MDIVFYLIASLIPPRTRALSQRAAAATRNPVFGAALVRAPVAAGLSRARPLSPSTLLPAFSLPCVLFLPVLSPFSPLPSATLVWLPWSDLPFRATRALSSLRASGRCACDGQGVVAVDE
ncbi:unnamed protein product [Prorocentrum cordatum]|uniref:Uncharacterized protein n=1 Tax=Prorocentrum cordatum TaxID=2364126 RepID=A0ABN9TV27_9DINO|nr:unnamed protein product [Polarella glacialis]